MTVGEADRERAHQVLDRMLEILARNAPSSGALRVRFDRAGELHLEPRDMTAHLEGPLTPKSGERKI
jgi:hypothetical protein